MPLGDYPKTVILLDGTELVIRPLSAGDSERLVTFFQNLPEEERILAKHDVTKREVVESWVKDIDYERVFPLIALEGEAIVGDATLHFSPEGWSRHVGEIHLTIAPRLHGLGLRRLLVRELAARATELGLDKVQFLTFQGDPMGITLCQRLGLTQTAVLPGLLKDWRGRTHNMVVMVKDVDELAKRIEDAVRCMGHRFRVSR
jgi:GNAT superfamily N-acetyltransferase